MKLQTEIALSPARNQIDYHSQVLLLGSCFTENIGGKLDFYKFQNIQNPFGILFHPIAISTLITRAVNDEKFTEEDIFKHNEIWSCFQAHSKLNAAQAAVILKRLNEALKMLRTSLFSASHIIITLGTAWVYRFIETDSIVANCHKIPQKKFLKELLSVEEISACLENIVTLIRSENQKVNFIFTVSPVRHLKDGFVENSRSKAHLLAGIHELVEPRKQLYYFPSYEIMMDELRDYRFYAPDMLHPNETAIGCIWEKFKHVWVSPETETLQQEIESIQNSLQHKPFNPESEAHKNFQEILQKKIASVKERLPHVAF